MILAGFPLPERPRNLDEARDRGFDPDSLHHDRVTPEPLDEAWQVALDGSVVNVQHRRASELVDDYCGERCQGGCDERMCAVYGPEPRACGTTCADCPCDCTTCVHVRQDMRADLLHRLEREAR